MLTNQNHPNFGCSQKGSQHGQGTHLAHWWLRIEGLKVFCRLTCLRDSCSRHLAEATPRPPLLGGRERSSAEPKMAARGRNHLSQRAQGPPKAITIAPAPNFSTISTNKDHINNSNHHHDHQRSVLVNCCVGSNLLYPVPLLYI